MLGGGVSHPSQLTTGLVIKSVTTSPTLAGERMLFILQVSILSEQTNNLAYAGARLVVELMEIKILQNNPSKWQPNQPPWKRRLEKQLTELRADLSKLNEMSASRLKNRKVRKELYEKYRIQEKGLNHIIEDVKQRVKAKAHKIQRYTNRNKGYQQNKLFQTNQKLLLNPILR